MESILLQLWRNRKPASVLLLSLSCRSITIPKDTIQFSDDSTLHIANSFCYGLSTLDISNFSIFDSFVSALAGSGAARTLRNFRARRSSLTDAICGSWMLFPALHSLDIQHARHLSVAGLQEIAKLSSLGELRISRPESSPCAKVLTTLLSGHSLPALHTLKGLHFFNEKSAEGFATLISALKARTTDLALLVTLKICFAPRPDLSPSDIDLLAQIHLLCPTLTVPVHPHGAAALLKAPEAFANLRRLDTLPVLKHKEGVEQADEEDEMEGDAADLPLVVERVREIAPLVEQIVSPLRRGVFLTRIIPDFASHFPNLTRMEFSSHSPLCEWTYWPPHLQRLSAALNVVSSTEERAAFVSNLCGCSPGLTTLSLRVANPFSPDQARNLLVGLSLLNSLDLASSTRTDGQTIPFLLSHPNLDCYPVLRLQPPVKIELGFLPRMIDLKNPVEKGCQLPEHFPFLERLVFESVFAETAPAANPAAAEFIRRSSHIHEFSFHLPLELGTLNLFLSKTNLTYVILRDTSISLESLGQVSSSLKYLRGFAICVNLPERPLNAESRSPLHGLSHRWLNFLDLQFRPCDQGAAPSQCPQASSSLLWEFAPSGARFPLLRQLMLRIPPAFAPLEVSFDNFPCVEHVALIGDARRTTGQAGCSLSIVRLPRITSFNTTLITSAVCVFEVPRLQSVILGSGFSSDTFTVSRFEVPSLEYLDGTAPILDRLRHFPDAEWALKKQETTPTDQPTVAYPSM